MGLSPERFAASDKFAKKAITNLGHLVKDGLRKAAKGTPAEEALNKADDLWAEANRFKHLVGERVRGKTGTESLSAIKDPKRMRAALDAMQPDELTAFKTLLRAKMLQDAGKTPFLPGKVGRTALALGAGGTVYASSQDVQTGVAVGGLGVLLELALRNPRVAILVSRGLKAPAGTAAATRITTALTRMLSEATPASVEE
jgi:hypothetical protein